MRKAVNKMDWKECEMEAGGRCNNTEQRFPTQVPRSIWLQLQQLAEWLSRTISSFPNISAAFYSYNCLHVLNKPFESLSDCLCLHQSARSCFLLPCYLNSIIPNRFPTVYLSFPSVTRDINIFVGFGWHSLKYTVERHNSHSSPNPCKHNNWAECGIL